ncbi:AAA family ATPase [Chlorobium sp. BLA1]|uniref:KGGVGR-motif variant AAA ATPase n=1 Tax=Candidatus Chlorobium masyuteum TaxID=2716876 RepID=UPI0014246AE5|nr:NB-ARC domain-containing protein [Candidatus Chlorobium masyuteum]NHQ60871.1 AAA family ATPase [Candidatus Chlorobium masyuteum]
MNKNNIISFYSFKGGSGRSQLVANLAAYLCIYENKKILIIDWDLDAPGIDLFFNCERKIINRGLIDVFEDYIHTVRSGEIINENNLPIFDFSFNILLNGKGGEVDLLPAANYNKRNFSIAINNFDWFDYYENLDGKYHLEFIKEKLKESKYDYILIDSRTGNNDYLGICNIQLPDINIIITTPALQNINGGFEIASLILANKFTKNEREKPIILPILSRLDASHSKKSNEWKNIFVNKFKNIIKESLNNNSVNKDIYQYIRDTSIDYVIELAYGETLIFDKKKKEITPGSIQEQFINIWNYIENKQSFKKFLSISPLFPDAFFGRTSELKAVRDILFSSGNLLIISGEGGIGKTSFTSKYYHTYSEEYNHLAWIFVDKNFADAILSLAHVLHVTFPDLMTKNDRIKTLLPEMAKLKKPCLLVIDNVNNKEDLEAYYHFFAELNNFHILITTRISFFWKAKKYTITPLDKEDAFKLFKAHYPAHNPEEDGLLNQILQAVGYNTLVIELLSKNLSNLNNQLRKRYTLSLLLEDLKGKGLFGISQSEKINTSYNNYGIRLHKEKPEAILSVMYNLMELDEVEKGMLSVFALLPAEPIAYSSVEELLPNIENLDKTLLNLAQKGWIEFNDNSNSFKCSPIVQEVTRFQNKEKLFVHSELLITTLTKKLDYEAGTGNLVTISFDKGALYARYAESILCLAVILQHKENISPLLGLVGNFHKTTGNLNKALTFFEQNAQLNKELYEEYPQNVSFKNGLAISYEKLGVTHSALGNLDKALTFFDERSRLGKELYEEYPQNVSFKNELAISYEKLGVIHSALGNLDKALTFFDERSRLGKELYEEYPQNASFKNGLAISYEKLGVTHSALGNHVKALTFFDDETLLFEELYEEYPQNVSFKNGLAISYAKLGLFYRDERADWAKARRYFEQAEAFFSELVKNYPFYAEFQKNWSLVKDILNAL